MKFPRATQVRVYFGWTEKPLVAHSLQEAFAALGGDGLTRGVTRIEYAMSLPRGSQNSYEVFAGNQLAVTAKTTRWGLVATTVSGSHYQFSELDNALWLITLQRWYNGLRPSQRQAWRAKNPEGAALVS